MVRIIVFVPSPDMLKPVQQQAAEWENDEISIGVVHRFGTPEILYQLDNYDVIVARGITYGKICKLYPEKHITRLLFDGMDIVAALFQCRNTYHPRHIGLCLGRDRLQDLLPELEDLSGAQVSLYDVQDEESAKEAVDACLRDGADAVVSGGTVSNLCRERGIPWTYIHMRMETIRQAVLEAVKVAHSMNLERTKSHIIRTILNTSEDAVLALDEAGKLLEANDQAYRLYGLAFLPEWRGTPIRDIRPELTYIGSRTSPCKDGDEELVSINGQRYMVKYRLISGETSAIGTLITTSSASRILQEEQHIRKGLVRRGLTSKYTFRDIIAVSERMCSKVDMAKKFSRVNSNVLLTGETGTDKELFAHSIHAASARANQPFVAVNCATLPELTLEAQELLKQYSWPGNVRELRNICERIVVMSPSRTIDKAVLMDLHVFRALSSEPAAQAAVQTEPLPVVLPPVIRKKDLAKELGVSRTTLWRMTKRQEQQKEHQT